MRNLLDSHGMIRSPSGCSEISSIRSFGGLGRGGSFLGIGLGGKIGGSTAIMNPEIQPSGQCYLGLALPIDLFKHLYGCEVEKKIEGNGVTNGITSDLGSSINKERFPVIAESELETVVEESSSKKGMFLFDLIF